MTTYTYEVSLATSGGAGTPLYLAALGQSSPVMDAITGTPMSGVMQGGQYVTAVRVDAAGACRFTVANPSSLTVALTFGGHTIHADPLELADMAVRGLELAERVAAQVSSGAAAGMYTLKINADGDLEYVPSGVAATDGGLVLIIDADGDLSAVPPTPTRP